jgi:hypothetical protein|nr:MAG TPA: hypothetical protein [Caudoviricetes sp.]
MRNYSKEEYLDAITKAQQHLQILTHDLILLNRDFIEQIKPTTLYQLSADYTNLVAEIDEKKVMKYDYRKYIPYVKVDGKSLTKETVKRSYLPTFTSILDKAILRKPEAPVPHACEHNEWEFPEELKNFDHLSYEKLHDFINETNPSDKVLRMWLIRYVFQYLIANGVIDDTPLLRSYERALCRYSYITFSSFYYNLFDNVHQGLFGLSKELTDACFRVHYETKLTELYALLGINNNTVPLSAFQFNLLGELVKTREILEASEENIFEAEDIQQAVIAYIMQGLTYTLMKIPYRVTSPLDLTRVIDLPLYSRLSILSRFGIPQSDYLPEAITGFKSSAKE